MSRRVKKIALIIAGSLVGLVVLVLVAGVIIVQTDWFRNFVREKIVSAVETATGGKAELGSFSFDWRHLRADVRNFVLHGLEPASAAPLFRANLVEVDLKLLSPFKGFVDIASLLVDTPQANVIVYPDGHTNVPAPKVKAPSSNTTGLETVVNLAIGHFDLRNGSLTLAERKSDFNASGANLRAQLTYNMLNPSYSGEIDMSPLNLKSGSNAPVSVDVKLPLTMEKDKIALNNAQLTTPQSKVVLTGEMDHLVAPRTSAHLNASLALDEVKRALGLDIALDTAHGPRVLNADVTASMDDSRIQLQSARVTLGHSNLEASGTLKDVSRPASVKFNSTLSAGEIGRLLGLAARPEGIVKAGGNATLNANSDYLVQGNLEGRQLAFTQGTTRISGVSIDSSVSADPHQIELAGLRLSVLGGSFAGSAKLQDMARFQVAGNLNNFDIDQAAGIFMKGKLGYDGIVSGPVQADGNIKDMRGLVARANLGIAPGPRGTPVTGRLNVDYNGRGDTIALGNSYIALPHTRADLSGSLGQQVQVHVVSRDMVDFAPLASIPVTFNGGSASVNATVSGSLSAPRIAGDVQVTNFSVDGRPFSRFSAAINASQSSASVSNAVLARGTLQAQFSGTVGLRNWNPESNQPLRADVTVRNADLRDILALAGDASVPVTGALSADAHITGTLGSPQGVADLNVANGTAEGASFDSLTAHALLTDRSITVPTLQWTAGNSQINATASYQHAVNDLQNGSLTAHIASNQVQLAQFQSLVKDRPGLRGVLTLTADAVASVTPAGIDLTSINGNAAARGLQMEGKNLGDATLTANTAGSAIRYDVNSNFAGSTIRVTGQSSLTGDHQTTASASIANLPIDRVLLVAGQHDLPVAGTLALTGQASGTLQDPHANVTFTVTNGSAYQEPFNRLQAAVNYTSKSIELSQFRVDDGPAYLELTGSFAHPENDLQNGQVQFHAHTNEIQVSRLHTLQQSEPGLSGLLQIAADGAATLRRNAAPLFSTLNANVSAKNLSMNQQALGDLTATASTKGSAVDFNLVSNFAHSNVRGSGSMQLGGDYPVNAQLNFSGITYAGLSPLLGGSPQPFDASVDGQISVTGPVSRTSELSGTVRLTKLEAHSTTGGLGKNPRVNLQLTNSGDIVASLARSVVTIQSFKITGPYANLTVTGTASMQDPQPVNIRADGNIKLEALEAFDTNIFSSGAVTLTAAVTGSTTKPVINGRLQMENASFNMLDLPNGLSNANGSVLFNGTTASIQNLSGEIGGGKATLAGQVSYGGPVMGFRVTAALDQVHVDYPATITTEANARLTLAGTTASSLVSGTVSILDVSLHSHSDMGSLLTSAGAPPAAPESSTGFLAGMRFDVKIQTAPSVQFRTALTQNLQADANLTLRGTADSPGMLGRVTVTQGDLVFFGTKYTIDQGTVSFFDPNRIEPVLNVDLGTTIQGIDVTLGVSGPVDRMKFTYRSDPPLQFQQIVSLLASGTTPTTDPVIAAHQPVPPQQNVGQAGASALVGQALANPVSGRLQRLFGVSRLSIDPQITGTTNTPQATLTLQQQIRPEVTFTYIQDLTQSNPQIIRVEWALSPNWSAIGERDVNGEFELNFFFKKRFH